MSLHLSVIIRILFFLNNLRTTGNINSIASSVQVQQSKYVEEGEYWMVSFPPPSCWRRFALSMGWAEYPNTSQLLSCKVGTWLLDGVEGHRSAVTQTAMAGSWCSPFPVFVCLQDTSDRDQWLHRHQEQDHSAVPGAHHHSSAGLHAC